MRRIRTPDDIVAGLAGLVACDPRLGGVLATAGTVPLRLSDPGYRGLADIIVSQMVSKASAAAIWRRMELGLGAIRPETVVAMQEAEARLFGLSRAKTETLKRVAQAVLDDRLDLHGICGMDAVAAIGELTAIRGIGRWTAEVYLLFCAGHPDLFPVGDVALQNAVGHAFGLDRRPIGQDLDGIAAAWAPWRGIAARLFWAYYTAGMGRDGGPSTV